ncbi:DgyrCDS2804 [Dimorphilus gyrociliatus]|uniref:DgyrCDS2804 n=1 Tax=Dimorphilus gyrociliatus TaxID=2664684 RepID=A0A7I8VD48_9ANNE|nr:DgyrCDS2804 [Dimorphilus gyrociliatus]
MKTLIAFCFFTLSSLSIGEIIYEVDDDLGIGKTLGNPAKESGLENLSKLTFVIADSLLEKYLEITDNGDLKTISILDRDAIPGCEGHLICKRTMEILVGPSQYFKILVVSIKIKDRNDNNPEFPQDSHEWRLVENSPINTRHLLPSAVDKDAGDYGRLRYELTDKSNEFRLEISGNDLELVLITLLDREEKDEYRMTIKATDGGGKTALLRILVIILDSNDHKPQFTKQTYIKTISEDFDPDSSVLRVVATDKDQGENGRIGYRFSKQTDENILQTFRLDESTGVIWTKKKLDYESISNYKFSIEAKDYGDSSIAAYAKVQIEVTDENDHSPEILVNSLSKKDVLEVSENSTTDTFVAYITVTDKDSGENAKINCVLNSNNLFKLVHLHSTEKKSEYELSTNAVSGFDREDKDEVSVRIICQDSGRPPQSLSKTITVKLRDVNDNHPNFYQKYYSKRIEEDNSIGIFILTVKASDRDVGVNAEISYSIPDISAKRYVTIDNKTGDIFAAAKFDREREETFSFRVMASDKGKPSLSNYALVNLHLKDVNDNPPVFTEEEYTFSIYENAKTPTLVGKVKAVDADAPPFDTVDYVIDADTTASFRIDRTGRIYSERSFDRELLTSHVIKVRAFNADKPEMRGIAQVRIDVRDANDNHPIIDYPNDQNNSVDLSNYSKIGRAVTRIKATDKDDGNNAQLQYAILNQNVPDAFFIEPETGK